MVRPRPLLPGTPFGQPHLLGPGVRGFGCSWTSSAKLHSHYSPHCSKSFSKLNGSVRPERRQGRCRSRGRCDPVRRCRLGVRREEQSAIC